ncbi:hypothetical protein METBIDRAFT_39931 [Metschnikowia bicuspidata var. bicuspidata NRRL YB-4993]|uniref:tRNA-splicing endonuclease subunit Sen15 domain-containing protein n=1 Tax=Metschnikowia bicuspidata var. bicuspidata NRRL YB-4993 TaxID=869754 RepID=A0A1A0HE58_9ASCO|nr:hypothetical protein METBIDRAFT_39931 [Metschnikowia bicuspidata var. bicuspidata NRRL YB-4993]OBA22394.1 hypothetical protein METBIDRAFT_39931 [Metschnikowia bicuspidata var. bicuspidata NRRL YB-4993]
MDLAAQVEKNLVHYNLWTDVRVFRKDDRFAVLQGQPPSKLAENDAMQPEWVVPKSMNDVKCSMAEIAAWFDYVATISERPKRVTMAIVQDDGTVVYYFVHDGVTAPRQN